MLPFTTYTIPESSFPQTPAAGTWLWMLLSHPPTDAESGLLSKMASALKADMMRDVFTLHVSPDEPASLAALIQPETKLLISFGIPPQHIGLWIDVPATGLRVMESFAFILTLPLPPLSTNASAKKELWNAMQTYMELYSHAS